MGRFPAREQAAGVWKLCRHTEIAFVARPDSVPPLAADAAGQVLDKRDWFPQCGAAAPAVWEHTCASFSLPLATAGRAAVRAPAEGMQKN